MRTFALALVAALASGCILVDAEPPGRSFALSWKLVDAAAPDPLAAPSLRCTEAGVATILFDGLDVDSGRRSRVEFACATLDGVTPPLPQSRYEVLLVARAADGTARSQTKFAADNYDDWDADLGLTIFQVVR